jgi:aspartate oxidase
VDECKPLHLVREGGHSKHRIVHHRDMTGKEVERALLESARAHPRVGTRDVCLSRHHTHHKSSFIALNIIL